MDFQLALQHGAQVEEFRRGHRTGLVTLLFTDILGSTQLKRALGTARASRSADTTTRSSALARAGRGDRKIKDARARPR